MPVEVDAVPSEDAPPAEAGVVVIGGGIVGASTALYLAERGVSTLLCEKGIVAGEQSSRNRGWCRAMGRDPLELPLMMHSLDLWRGMNGRVGAETGFRQTGTLYICPDAAALAKREAWLPHAHAVGLASRLVGGSEMGALIEGARGRWAGASTRRRTGSRSRGWRRPRSPGPPGARARGW